MNITTPLLSAIVVASLRVALPGEAGAIVSIVSTHANRGGSRLRDGRLRSGGRLRRLCYWRCCWSWFRWIKRNNLDIDPITKAIRLIDTHLPIGPILPLLYRGDQFHRNLGTLTGRRFRHLYPVRAAHFLAVSKSEAIACLPVTRASVANTPRFDERLTRLNSSVVWYGYVFLKRSAKSASGYIYGWAGGRGWSWSWG